MTTGNKVWIVLGLIGFVSSLSQLLWGNGLWHLCFVFANAGVIYMNAVVLPQQYEEIDRLKKQYNDLNDHQKE